MTIAAAVELALKGIEFTGESLKGAEQVEASLSRVQALAAGAAAQPETFEKAVDEAARSVNVSTQTSAQGLAALAAQGLTADQAIKALVPTRCNLRRLHRRTLAPRRPMSPPSSKPTAPPRPTPHRSWTS